MKKRVCEIAWFAQWCVYGSELAIVLDEQGWPYIFAHMTVWPEGEEHETGAYMGITRNVDNTVVCFFNRGHQIRFGSITNEQRDALFDGNKPKYLKVQRIFVGECEQSLPITH